MGDLVLQIKKEIYVFLSQIEHLFCLNCEFEIKLFWTQKYWRTPAWHAQITKQMPQMMPHGVGKG